MSNGRLNLYLRSAPSLDENLPPKRKVAALLSDSKGNYLEKCMSYYSKDSEVQRNIKWWCKKGRTTYQGLSWITSKINRKLRRHGDIHLYVWLGTCDLTGKSGRFIYLKDSYARDARILINTLERFDLLARRKQFTFTLFEVPYYSIEEHNKCRNFRNPEIFKDDDITLKTTIEHINRRIAAINERNGTYSPSFNYDLRRNRSNRGRRKKYYINYKLYRDGLHPDTTLSNYWLRKLCECVRRDCYLALPRD